MLGVGGDGTYDWESDIFLNESSVVASDDSPVGAVVKAPATLVDAFNDHIPENGDGSVNIPIAVKRRVRVVCETSNIDITYAMQTHAVGASFEGGLAPTVV